MTLPLVFEPSAFGREVVRLGVIVIGEVAPYHGAPRIHAYARLFLPDVTARPLPAASIEKARQIVIDKARDWVEAAGLRA